VIAAHRHVFGVFFWYVILSIIGLGPVGAVIYRLTEFAQRRWQRAAADGASASDVLGAVSLRAWQFMDRLPSRMTALGFAIVGSFEDAMDGWRHHAQNFPQDNDGVILAATAGAINIRLGGAALTSSEEEDDETLSGSSSTPGRIASQSHFAQVVGLVWRTMIMWLLLLALLTMANLIG
jgi:adenosylcobinamide-phosphate synthase